MSSGIKRLLPLTSALAAAVAACVGSDAGPPDDASSTDGGTSDSAADGGGHGAIVVADGVWPAPPADVLPNGLLLDDGSLETDGCGGWTAAASELSTVTDGPYDGAHACRVCGTTGASFWGLTQTLYLEPAEVGAGITYRMSAWVRRSVGDEHGRALRIQASVEDPPVYVTSDPTVEPPASYAWVELTKDFAPGLVAREKVPVEIAIKDQLGERACFVVDRVTLTKVKTP